MAHSIADIRKDYILSSLSENDVEKDPMVQFERWWAEALNSDIIEVNAMTLATASAEGVPSARIVLLKGFDKDGFIFFSNYESFKGKDLQENPRACLVFFWKELERQVRITGVVNKLDEAANDEYYYSRPVGSQIGAIASPQSHVIENREWLEKRVNDLQNEFSNKKITRPAYWGGYIVQPVSVEFWQGRESRLHDRIQYTLQEGGNWMIERLSP
ncbi:MAG: pyridoxamine 5'-phosphate oxidase [Flavitalea sp.]